MQKKLRPTTHELKVEIAGQELRRLVREGKLSPSLAADLQRAWLVSMDWVGLGSAALIARRQYQTLQNMFYSEDARLPAYQFGSAIVVYRPALAGAPWNVANLYPEFEDKVQEVEDNG